MLHTVLFDSKLHLSWINWHRQQFLFHKISILVFLTCRNIVIQYFIYIIFFSIFICYYKNWSFVFLEHMFNWMGNHSSNYKFSRDRCLMYVCFYFHKSTEHGKYVAQHWLFNRRLHFYIISTFRINVNFQQFLIYTNMCYISLFVIFK